MAAGAEIQGSCAAGRVREDEMMEVVDNSFECIAAESWGRKGLNIEQGQERDRDSKEFEGERRCTRDRSGKQDNTCTE